MNMRGVFLAMACGLWFGAAGNLQAESYTFTTSAGWAGHPAGVIGNADGTNAGARFYGSAGVALDPAGGVYVADGNAIRRMVKIGTNWVVTTLAGIGAMHGEADGTNTDARFNAPQGVVVDNATNIFVADTYNHSIRLITPIGTNWVVTTLAGSNTVSGVADGTNGAARFNRPYGIAMD